LAALFVGACDSCQEDKPYTPFGVTSALPSASAAETSVAEPTPAAEPQKYPGAVVAPAGSRKLRMGEQTLLAPKRYVFEQAVVLGDGAARQAVAWVTAAAGEREVARGALIAYSASGEQRQLMALPSFVPMAPGCTHATRLAQTGKNSVLVDTRASCTTPLLARVPVQAVSVVSPASAAPELLTLRIAAPAQGETISVDEDSTDRDGDGRDDVRFIFTLTGPDGIKANAELAFLDRAAGVSRDAAEPSASLLIAAKALLARAGSAANGATVLGEIDATRRLLATLCAEGETPRVFDAEGSPIRCGDLGGTIDLLARAEVLARLARKDALGAVSVLSRGDWYFKKLSPDAEKSISKELVKRLLAVTPSAVWLTARPKVARGPHWSPLWFESDGALLIVTDAGVVRASRDGTTELAVDPDAGGAVAWPLDVLDPGGRKLSGSLCACDSSEVQLSLSSPSAASLPGIPTPLLSPRPGGCKSRFLCPDPTPVAASEGGYTVLLAGSLIQPAKAESPALPSPGSARSPDGKWLVASSGLGLVLSGPTQELWKLPDAPLDARRATDCVVASDRTAVACVADGKAILFRRP